jgi:hypothetical protein
MHEKCTFIHFSGSWSHGALQRSVDFDNSRVAIIKLCKKCVNAAHSLLRAFWFTRIASFSSSTGDASRMKANMQ